MQMFAIRNMVTGNFLPYTKKGNTTVEPLPMTEACPRLFKSKRGAQLALSAWAKGVHQATWEYPDCEYGGYGAYVSDIQITPKPRRNKAEFEIVMCNMSFEVAP